MVHVSLPYHILFPYCIGGYETSVSGIVINTLTLLNVKIVHDLPSQVEAIFSGVL